MLPLFKIGTFSIRGSCGRAIERGRQKIFNPSKLFAIPTVVLATAWVVSAAALTKLFLCKPQRNGTHSHFTQCLIDKRKTFIFEFIFKIPYAL